MLDIVNALVLATTPQADRGFVAHCYTLERGRLSLLARSGRSPVDRTALMGYMKPLSILKLSYTPSPHPEHLHPIHDVEDWVNLAPLYRHPLKAALAAFMAEVGFRLFTLPTPQPDYYHFLLEAVQRLAQVQTPSRLFHDDFLLELACLLGFAPRGCYSDATPAFSLREGCFCAPGARDNLQLPPSLGALWQRLLLQGYRAKAEGASTETLKALTESLLDYIAYHAGVQLKVNSLPLLEALLLLEQ